MRLAVRSPSPRLLSCRGHWQAWRRCCLAVWLRCLPGLWRQQGLEIGGPSGCFRSGSLLPIYGLVARVDNVNFAARTVWGQVCRPDQPFEFSPARPPGSQNVAEATRLTAEPTGGRAFLLASHMLEHVANPLAALREWARVLRPGGLLVLVLPHREGTFDHRRPVTPLAHLLQDDAQCIGEDDLTHLPEVLALHDLSRDPDAGDAAHFARRCRQNLHNRCLHHHVFNTRAALALMDHAGWQILGLQLRLPYHIVLACRRPEPGRRPRNSRWLSGRAAWRRRSPFETDREPGAGG